jgi:hypothetical protein
VQELLASESWVTEFARIRGLRANQICKWRRFRQKGLLNGAEASEGVLLAVKTAEPSSVAISNPRGSIVEQSESFTSISRKRV